MGCIGHMNTRGCLNREDFIVARDYHSSVYQIKINIGDSVCMYCSNECSAAMFKEFGWSPNGVLTVSNSSIGKTVAASQVAPSVAAHVKANDKAKPLTLELTHDERSEMLGAIAMSSRMIQILPRALHEADIVKADGPFQKNCDKKLSSLNSIELKLERLK